MISSHVKYLEILCIVKIQLQRISKYCIITRDNDYKLLKEKDILNGWMKMVVKIKYCSI